MTSILFAISVYYICTTLQEWATIYKSYSIASEILQAVVSMRYLNCSYTKQILFRIWCSL